MKFNPSLSIDSRREHHGWWGLEKSVSVEIDFGKGIDWHWQLGVSVVKLDRVLFCWWASKGCSCQSEGLRRPRWNCSGSTAFVPLLFPSSTRHTARLAAKAWQPLWGPKGMCILERHYAVDLPQNAIHTHAHQPFGRARQTLLIGLSRTLHPPAV